MRPLAALHLPLAAALLALPLGCASDPAVDPRYRPAENVLEVVSVLRRHVPDDTYRFEPARDFTGRNVYRSSLLRLESLEHVHAQSLLAGHMDGVMAFAKARSLERLRGFDLAADHYRLAAEREEMLRVEALRSADVCDELFAAAQVGLDLDDLVIDDPNEEPVDDDAEAVLADFELRVTMQEELLEAVAGTHHVAIVREEIERSDMARGEYFMSLRKTLEDGDVRAVAELQRVVLRHEDSKMVNEHLLDLGDLYAELAEEYADANPPESLDFDPVRFQELVDAGSRLYEMVASKDGTAEKLEASRRLEAFLAFALRVDHDRFTP